MKTITLPVYRRADRLKETLAGLRRNRLDGYTLFVQAEPGYPEVHDLARKIDFMPVSLEVNPVRLGLNGNIQAALTRAMKAGSEFNVALEDDILLAPDALDLAEWFYAHPARDAYASLGFFAYKSDAEAPREVRETQDFRSWGYCFGRASWERYFVQALKFRYPIDPSVKHQDMWDFWVQFYFVMNGIPTLHPALSRSNHLGLDDGTNALPEIRRYFEEMVLSDGSVRSGFEIRKLPATTWECARKLCQANLKAAV